MNRRPTPTVTTFVAITTGAATIVDKRLGLDNTVQDFLIDSTNY